MGEAKTKRQLKDERRRARIRAMGLSKTFPIRFTKAVVGVLIAPFILFYMCGRSCFVDNVWPWEKLVD